MIETEIILLTNNMVIPFQKVQEHLDFMTLNKLFATKSLAEHGLGFLINIYDVEDPSDEWGKELINKIVFDTGGDNKTFLHNVDVRGYALYDVNTIVLSHWHYDHSGGLFEVLARVENEVPVISHESSQFERFFRRSSGVKTEDLKGKSREEIVPLLNAMKIVNQEPLDAARAREGKGSVIFSKEKQEIFKANGLKISVSGEIPRNHSVEDFHDYFFLKEGVLKEDQILDDKCLIFEFEKNLVVLNGCCHSGLMNTLDYVKEQSNKPITHVIGGFHMASASEKRITETIEYLKDFRVEDVPLYLFPIHCTGEPFLNEVRNAGIPNVEAYNVSVGSIFRF